MQNLPARTSVVAAANPYGGHYNKARTISVNVKMSTSLLSRQFGHLLVNYVESLRLLNAISRKNEILISLTHVVENIQMLSHVH